MNPITAWWKARQKAKQDAWRRQLEALWAAYPHDERFIVAGLLSPVPAIQLAASQTLRRSAEQRAFELTLRTIIREECHK
jgi:hypothetical protein